MDWYYADAGRQLGPVNDEALAQLVTQGTIRGHTLVWHAGLANWQPYQSLTNTATTSNCIECNRPFAPDELISFGTAMVCGECKPIYTQKLREGVLRPQRMHFAGFWIRLGALAIDTIILYIFAIIFAGIIFGLSGTNFNDMFGMLRAEGILGLIQIVITTAYEVWFLGKFGATPGKLACHIFVIQSNGEKISYQKAFARYGAKFISSFTLGIGYLMAAFDEEKRALHDRICDTRVVRK